MRKTRRYSWQGSFARLCGTLTLLAALLLGGCVRYNQRLELPPLHEAAMDGDLVRARSLLADGADPNSRDSRGDPPLYWALVNRQFAVADELLRCGAKVDADGMDGKTLEEHFTECGNPCRDVMSWIRDRKSR